MGTGQIDLAVFGTTRCSGKDNPTLHDVPVAAVNRLYRWLRRHGGITW